GAEELSDEKAIELDAVARSALPTELLPLVTFAAGGKLWVYDEAAVEEAEITHASEEPKAPPIQLPSVVEADGEPAARADHPKPKVEAQRSPQTADAHIGQTTAEEQSVLEKP